MKKKILSTGKAIMLGLFMGLAFSATAKAATNDNYLESKFDPIEEGMGLPEIRDQNPYGACSRFAGIGLMECSLYRRYNVNMDLSEDHLIYFLVNEAGNPHDPSVGANATEFEGNLYDNDIVGGVTSDVEEPLLHWVGAAEESRYPYASGYHYSTLDAYTYNVAHLQNVYRTSVKNDRELTKKLIKKYGAVSISYYDADEYYSYEYNSYNCTMDSPGLTNHATVIVGWDDNFPKENFLGQAGADGAWLVRNSWGINGYDHAGYFWMSYYSGSLLGGRAFDAVPIGNDAYFDNIYFKGSNRTYAMPQMFGGGFFEIFTIDGTSAYENIMAVGTETISENVPYEISIYKLNPNAIEPYDGELIASSVTKGSLELPGYHTIMLDNDVILKKGDRFSVVVTLIREDVGQLSNRLKVYTNDCGNTVANVSVKKIDVSSFTDTINMDDTLGLSVEVYPASATNKKVTWSSSDTSVATVDEYGVVHPVGVGSVVITATSVDGSKTDYVTLRVSNESKFYYICDAEKYRYIRAGLGKGESLQFYVTGYPAGSSDILQNITSWTSDDTSVATVTPDGKVTAVSAGMATITAKFTVGGVPQEAFCYVEVPMDITAISDENSNIEVKWDNYSKALKYQIDFLFYKEEGEPSDLVTFWDVPWDASGKTFGPSDFGRADMPYDIILTPWGDGYPMTRGLICGIEYKISYKDADGGAIELLEGAPTSYFPVIENKDPLKMPNKPDQLFEGWCIDGDSQKNIGLEIPRRLTGDLTLYASWGDGTQVYPINYHMLGGTYPSGQTEYSYGDQAITLGTPEREGYIFQGWYDNHSYRGEQIATIPVGTKGPVDLYAKWKGIECRIKFDSNCPLLDVTGTMPDIVFEFGKPITKCVPTLGYNLPGYDFMFWGRSPGSDMVGIVEGNPIDTNGILSTGGVLTLYAYWHEDAYHITYHEGGIGNEAVIHHNIRDYNSATPVTVLEDPFRPGFFFKGWYTDSEYKNQITQISGADKKDYDIYAKWEKEHYNITYDPNGGNLPAGRESTDVMYVDTGYENIPTPTRYGYNFKGWFKSDDGNPLYPRDVYYCDITVKAQWEAIYAQIRLDANGGYVSNSDVFLAYGENYDVELLGTPYREGYTFEGWYTSREGGTKITSSTKMLSIEELTLYAHWKKDSLNEEDTPDTPPEDSPGGGQRPEGGYEPDDNSPDDGQINPPADGDDVPNTTDPFKDNFMPEMIEDQVVYADTTADPATLDCKFYHRGGKSYWYENGVRQGTYDDPKGVIGDGTVRGREVCDMESAAWYWCDSVYDGAKAINKEVWMPYIYQNEKSWSDQEIRQNAEASGNMVDQVERDIKAHTGKWVRYNANGKMFKGWYKVTGSEIQYYPSQVGNIYYYDPKTGLMAKGSLEIDGVMYYFDEVSGVLQR